MIVTLLAGFLVGLGFIFGASIASFLGVVYDRHSTGESINDRSHCSCGRQLKNSENIPVLGWLRAKGTAACCGATLPVWMVISEVLLGVAVALPLTLLLF